jgi:hypothetical protein
MPGEFFPLSRLMDGKRPKCEEIRGENRKI